MECHSTPERRIDRAWEQRERSVPLTDGKFLDVNLSDDHPVEGARRSSLWRRSLVGRLGRSPGGIPAETADRLVHDAPPAECSACHDPHSYSDATSDPSSVRSLCLSCHDPTYYALDEHITPSCVDCHVMHAAPGDDLLRSREPEDTCGACHLGTVSFGTVTVDPALRGPPGHDDVRTDRCVDCHQVHARGG
jgi:predicted CXXCH cytochrome family protein